MKLRTGQCLGKRSWIICVQCQLFTRPHKPMTASRCLHFWSVV